MTTRPRPAKRRISTRSLDALPPPDMLLPLCRAVALLDHILEPDWSMRFFSFDPAWRPGEELASMRSAEGDFYFVWFSSLGCVIRGHTPGCPMAQGPTPWPGLFAGFPEELRYAVEEPAFARDEVTFCIWRRARDRRWQIGDVRFPEGVEDPDGSERLLWMVDGNPETHVRFAVEYHEVDLDPNDVAKLYAGEPVTPELVLRFNPNAEVNRIMKKAKAMGMKTSSKPAKKASVPAKQAAKPKQPAKKAPPEEDEDDDLIGEAEFKVITVGDTVKMVVGGKAVAEAKDEALYDELFDHVEAALKSRRKRG